MKTFAQKVINFNKELHYSETLPHGIKVLNPFKENKEINSISEAFYTKYYSDSNKRKLILGINPGRLGAGATGIPFTDTKRLREICGINIESVSTHEPSSVFIYEMISKYGGSEKFYKNYFITSMSPLGFIEKNQKGNWVNCNYYDYDELFDALYPFILASLTEQISFGIDTKSCFVLGKKNAKYLKIINDREKLFELLVVVDHPRYIEQYKSKLKENYIDEYLTKLG
ncbi:MAG: DUF4918 family protein [Bacteroidales bacterium]|nr:DUF4918 family protein [Bacteroidales bacterium]MCF8391890.1 DUF4918 family protein [Bacteroidales bacterium]